MCFIDKRKRNWIRKKDHVLDPVRPPGRVWGLKPSHIYHIIMELQLLVIVYVLVFGICCMILYVLCYDNRCSKLKVHYDLAT